MKLPCKIIIVTTKYASSYPLQNPSVVPRLVELLSGSYTEAESAATIISKCCQSSSHQALLCNTGAIDALLPLLSCNIPKIQLPALHCYAAASHQNGSVSLAMMSGRACMLQIINNYSCTPLCKLPISDHDKYLHMKELTFESGMLDGLKQAQQTIKRSITELFNK